MTEKKLSDCLVKYPYFQYPYYCLLGVVKQFKYLFSSRGIAYSGEQPFLLIVGSGRSGNTLLRKLLMERGDIYIPPESYVFGQEVITCLNAYSLSWSDKVELVLAKIEYHPEFSTFGVDTLREFSIYAKGFNKEKQKIGTLIVEFYQWLAKKKEYSSTWLGDKTPLNTLQLGLITKLFPNAKYIYIERDGVDVCHSYIQSGIYNDIEFAAHRWKNSKIAWQTFKQKIPDNCYMEIKYECLVKNHEQEIERVFEKFKIPRYKKNICVSKVLGDVGIRVHHKNLEKIPNGESIGKGRKLLSKQEREILQSIFGDELKKSGYSSL